MSNIPKFTPILKDCGTETVPAETSLSPLLPASHGGSATNNGMSLSSCFASLNHFVVFYPISHFAVSSSFFFLLYDFPFLLSLNLYGLYGILLCVCVLVA